MSFQNASMYSIFWTWRRIPLSIFLNVTIYMEGASMYGLSGCVYSIFETINKLYKINGYWFGCFFDRIYEIPPKHCKRKSNGFLLWSGQTIQFINIQISILLHFILSFIDFSTLFRLTWLEYWTKKCCARSVNHGGAVQF